MKKGITFEESLSLEHLYKEVKMWAEDKKLLNENSVFAQYTYFRAELYEVSVAKGLNLNIEVGDVLVTLFVLCHQFGITFEELMSDQSIRPVNNMLLPQLLILSKRKERPSDIKSWIACCVNSHILELQEENDMGDGDLPKCLYLALQKIKNRKGKMIDGAFIKE